jgi:hypothetical protein
MPFENLLPAGSFDVTMTGPSVHESGGAPPTTIIRTDQPWHVHVQWDTSGSHTGMIGGTWHLHIYLETIGPGDDLELFDEDPLNEHDIPLTPGPSPRHYHYHPDVPAGKVPPGAYKLALTLTYTDLANNPGPMAGYWEGPIIQFYKPNP